MALHLGMEGFNFMKNKKFYIYIIIIASLFLITGLFYFYKNKSINFSSYPKDKQEVVEAEIRVSLDVLDKKYQIHIGENSSVFDLMNKIQTESSKNDSFVFKYKEYKAMGAFIEEINGVRNTKDQSWIYYVNGVKASVGVSNYKIKDGDIISFKYEK